MTAIKSGLSICSGYGQLESALVYVDIREELGNRQQCDTFPDSSPDNKSSKSTIMNVSDIDGQNIFYSSAVFQKFR